MITQRNLILRDRFINLFWLLSPSILAVLIVLPRLESAQFGLLCDGNTLVAARQMGAGSWPLWDFQGRRSRPIYWIYWFLVSMAADQDPFWFYVLQTVFLFLLVIAIVHLFRGITSKPIVAWMGGLLFVLSGPVIENFYTLSKSEPLALFWLTLSLILGIGFHSEKNLGGKTVRVLMITGLIFMAEASKETALVILPISAAWLVVSSFRQSISTTLRSKQATYFLSALIASLCFLLMRYLLVGGDLIGSGYSDQYQFTLARLFSSGSRWAAWILHDFAYVLPLGIFLLIRLVKREPISHSRVLFMSLVWMAGWVSIYLFWIFVADYYLLPFAAALALFSAILFFDMISHWRVKSKRAFMTPILVLASIGLLLITLPNNLTMATQQLKADAANARLLEYLAEELESGQSVGMNIPAQSEYIEQLSLLLNELYGLRVSITGVDPGTMDSTNLNSQELIINAEIANQVLLSPRLGLYELVQKEINQGNIIDNRSERKLVHTIKESYSIFNIDLPRIVCPLIEMTTGSGGTRASKALSSIGVYCSAAPLLDRSTFTYTWLVYR